MITAGPAQLLTGLLAEFYAAHPGVEMTLTEAPSDELFAALRVRRRSTWPARRSARARPTGVETHVVIDSPVVAAVAARPSARRSAPP